MLGFDGLEPVFDGLEPAEDGLLGAVQALEQPGDVGGQRHAELAGRVLDGLILKPFRSVIALRLFLSSSRNAGVRMKSSRLRDTASSQRRWICCGSPAACITSSSAWVPRLDCSSHWVQNEVITAAGSAAALELAWSWFRWMTLRVGLLAVEDGSADRLDGHGNSLAAADAQGGDAALAAGVLQSGQERDQQPRAAAADRVAQRNGPAVDVGLRRRQAQFLAARQGDDGEGLVELEQVDVWRRSSRPCPAVS